jgi:hypothetical protein
MGKGVGDASNLFAFLAHWKNKATLHGYICTNFALKN